MTRILVTGARGLLGSHVVPLLADKAEVIPLDHKALDLARPLDTARLPRKLDAIIYLAQSNLYRDFPESAADVFQVNTAQCLALLDYARQVGVTNFVYASTGSVYGSSDELLTEDSPTPPAGQSLGFYPATKLAAETLALAYAPYLNLAILRYFFIYGPGQKSDMLIPRLIASVMEQRPITLQGTNGLHINPVHASDAAAATVAAASLSQTAIINVAGPDILSLREIGDQVGRTVGLQPRFSVTPMEQPPRLVADAARMRELLVAPKTRFKDAVSQLIHESRNYDQAG